MRGIDTNIHSTQLKAMRNLRLSVVMQWIDAAEGAAEDGPNPCFSATYTGGPCAVPGPWPWSGLDVAAAATWRMGRCGKVISFHSFSSSGAPSLKLIFIK